MDYDVAIIGAGVTGCALARELSRYDWKVCVLEKNEDVCSGTSKANSGIVHSGIDARYGTLKARMNVEGNQMMEPLAKKLDFPFRRNGSLVVCFEEADRGQLIDLLENGKKNGVPDLTLLNGEEARSLEPGLSEQVVAAVYAPTGGIVCPFGLTIALAENAAENGVEFHFLTEVKKIFPCTEESGYCLSVQEKEEQKILIARYVVNAAGVYADTIHNMISSKKRTIIPRRGEYCLFDKSEGKTVDKTIFQLPTSFGKGVLVTPTIHGNLLAGPNACDTEKEAIATTAEGLAEVLEKAGKSLSGKGLNTKKIITSFAGLRAHTEEEDFTLEEVSDASGFFDALGIESPGLSAAPAIGRFLAGLIRERAEKDRKASSLPPLEEKQDFKEERKGIPSLWELSEEERTRLLAENPDYGNIICRCEHVSEGEIRSAIRRPLGAKSLDGVKRRTRAGMGRCQSGFCSPKVLEILAEELGVSPEEITKAGPGSEILQGGPI